MIGYRNASRFFWIMDGGLFALCFWGAYQLRFSPAWMEWFPAELVPDLSEYHKIVLILVLLGLALLKLLGVYEPPRFGTIFDEIARLGAASFVGVVLFFGLLFLYREFWVSRQVVIIGWALFAGTAAMGRLIHLGIYALGVRWGRGIQKVLIIGKDEEAQNLTDEFSRKKRRDVVVVASMPEINLTKLREQIRQHKVDEVIVTSRLAPSHILDVITECEMEGVAFRIVPGLLEMMATRLSFDELGGVPLLSVSEIRLQGIQAFTKRTLDLIVSGLLLLILSPLFLLVALLVKIDSRGPVFFRQVRVTRDNRLFVMLKFRTMHEDAEKKLPKLATRGAKSEGKLFKIKDDPRITRVGKWLRKLSLDELPQLVNVFIGDMSLVGPRPPLPREVRKYSAWDKKRLRVRAGITGLWQVSGRSDIPFEEMVKLDIYYIENWSLWFDVKLILRTIPAVVTSRGAY